MSVRARRWLLLLLLVATAVFATAGIAEATVITTWKGIQPTGNAGTNLPVSISGSGVYSLSPLAPSTAKLLIDGVAVPRSSYTASIGRSSVYFYYVVQPKLTDGAHTFRVEVSDGQGRLSFREWTANIVEPPTASWVSPAAGSSDRTGRPAIVMALSDNTPGTTFTVAGQVHAGSAAGPVAATFGGAGLSAGQASFTLPSELAPGIYYLTATVTDAAGNARILAGIAAREFATVPAATMTILSECDDCHAAYRTAHQTRATTDCMVCHPGYDGDHMQGTDYCEDCHWQGWHNGGAKREVAVTSACTSCHGVERPEVKQHTAASVEGSHAGSCGGCHETSLITKHAYTPEGSAYASQCDLCHASTDPAVAAAIVRGDATCDACHDEQHAGMDAAHAYTGMDASCLGAGCHFDTLPEAHSAFVGEGKRYPQYEDSCELCHDNADPERIPVTASADCVTCHDDLGAGHLAVHATNTSTTVLAGTSAMCGDCHDANMLTEHAKGSASSAASGCDSCHPDPRSAITAHDDATCAQAECHVPASATAMHGQIGEDHALPASATACFGDGCHAGTGLAGIHTEASTTTAGVTKTSCLVCHYGGLPTTNDCGTCHPDRLLPHGYEPADHTADESCVLTCHGATAEMRELKPVHDAAAPNVVSCGDCHTALVPSFSSRYPAGWDKTCTACHPIAELHPARAAAHTGTDVAYQNASYFGNGCSNATGIEHTTQAACHDISNVAAVHSGMAGNGCPACHGPGKTPSRECLDCHKPGYADTYTVPGPASANIYDTSYPSSDVSITPGWTYTTTPASQPIYAVVNSPYPPVDTTRFVTITSNTGGGVLFGLGASAIPDGARITDVRIYAKGRTATATNPRKMQGVFKIGGQTFLSSNQSNNLTTSWTAGAGTGFATPSTRVDFTREPLFGELLWMNPKTGQDWTPAELNGTDPDSSLEAIGINLTASAVANNVSVSQIYLKVTYYTVGPEVTNPTVGTHIYHEANVKYLHDPSDAPAGQRFLATAPAHGWYTALYYQDCWDFCHRGNYGDPTFSASQGSWMWYSVGGDPADLTAATRTLSLRPITVPSDAPVLRFDTNYRLGTGAAGYVEISTDGGGNWTALSGTVGGTSLSSLTGNASGWLPASYDLSAYAGQSAQLRFRYVNGSSTSEGWAFDSMAITGGGVPVFSDDAETLKPDWANKYWTRSMGAFPK